MQSNAQSRHTVTGTVINSVTGEPIRRALVRINGPEQHFGFSGPDGRFQIDGVPDGTFFVIAQKPGFFDELSIPHPIGYHAASFVAIGPTTGDVQVKLIPEAKVQGRIVDGDGEPVEGVAVNLIAQELANGRRQWQSRGGSSTNENGVYHVDNLQPGRYMIRSEPHSVFPGYWKAGSDGRLVPEVYASQFYPNAPDFSAAQLIDLQAGEQTEADFTLSTTRSFTVSGTVQGVQSGGMWIECLDSEGVQVSSGWRLGRRPGSFAVSDIPAGSWIIRFHSNDGQGHTYFAEQLVNLSASNIDDLQVQLQLPPAIPIHIANGPDPRINLQLQLISDRGWQNNSFAAFPQPGDPPGSLAFRDVPPGVYKLSFQSFGAGCVESVMSGNVDLTRNDFTITAGSAPPPIDVSLLTDCATISGSLTGNGEQMNGVVILVPASSSMQPTVMVVQGNGKFTLPNVAPGEYRLYAFSDITGLEYANPDALRDFPSQQVQVTAGQQAQVEIELIQRGGQ